MLGKSKGTKEEIAPITSTTSLGEKTIIGNDISIQGEIRGKEDLLVDGAVKGSIQLEGYHLTVGPKGQVEAEVVAENVTISGRLVGDIKAGGKVEITKQADFNGEIKAKNLSVEDGAYLKAVIEIEPYDKVEPIAKPVDKVGPGLEATPLSLASEAEEGK